MVFPVRPVHSLRWHRDGSLPIRCVFLPELHLPQLGRGGVRVQPRPALLQLVHPWAWRRIGSKWFADVPSCRCRVLDDTATVLAQGQHLRGMRLNFAALALQLVGIVRIRPSILDAHQRRHAHAQRVAARLCVCVLQACEHVILHECIRKRRGFATALGRDLKPQWTRAQIFFE